MRKLIFWLVRPSYARTTAGLSLGTVGGFIYARKSSAAKKPADEIAGIATLVTSLGLASIVGLRGWHRARSRPGRFVSGLIGLTSEICLVLFGVSAYQLLVDVELKKK